MRVIRKYRSVGRHRAPERRFARFAYASLLIVSMLSAATLGAVGMWTA